MNEDSYLFMRTTQALETLYMNSLNYQHYTYKKKQTENGYEAVVSMTHMHQCRNYVSIGTELNSTKVMSNLTVNKPDLESEQIPFHSIDSEISFQRIKDLPKKSKYYGAHKRLSWICERDVQKFAKDTKLVTHELERSQTFYKQKLKDLKETRKNLTSAVKKDKYIRCQSCSDVEVKTSSENITEDDKLDAIEDLKPPPKVMAEKLYRKMTSFMTTTGLSPPSHQDVLDSSARLIDKQLQDDRNCLELSDQLKVPVHNQPSHSGLNEFDYPSFPDAGVALDCLTEVSNVKRVPLPAELVEQFGRMQCNCMMGLFPDISRAWLTIDSDIFVWKYEDGLKYCSTKIVVERPFDGIFQPHIQYLLCLATPVDIVLLGVTFRRPFDGSSSSGGGDMHLLPEYLFSIPTDNTFIMNIIGTDNGRIFMAGKDGLFIFQIPSFLNFSFSEDDPLVQLCIDKSRNILYARTEKGTIQVFDLGQDGKSIGKVTSVPLATIVHNASHVARTIERSNFKPIVHISAITQSESSNIHLVAVTKTGVRLYFTTNPFGSNKGRPSMLTLVHVRLPPGFSATSRVQKPQNVHMAYYKKGSLLLVSSQTEDSDLLWTMSPDSFPFQSQLMEAQTTTGIDGKTWALCEESSDNLTSGAGKTDPPAIVTQHSDLPRKFVLLSAQGSHILTKLRPVDQLRLLLIEYQGPDADEVKGFFRLHKIEQACATCLILACSRIAADQQVSNWATMAFFMYGGDAQYNLNPGMGDRGLMASNIGPGKHNGICLNLSRILRSVWDSNVVSDFPCQTQQGIVNLMNCNLSNVILTEILENVRGLSDFMDFNSRFDTGPADTGVMPAMAFSPRYMMSHGDDQIKKKLQAEAQKMEKISLQHVQDLIHQVEEVLGLLKVLCDHPFHHVAAALSKDQQNQLRTMTLKQLVVTGKEMCTSLITSLINIYLNDNASIDLVNARLREVCPTLYSSDDATCSKANELLQAARVNQNQTEKRKQLLESLKLYKEVTQPLQLPGVCNSFALVHFFEGIVDLCLTLSAKRDPQQLALHYYRSGEPQEDLQGMTAHLARMECYNCITDTLGYLMSASVSHPQAPSIPKGPGPPPTPDPSILNATDAEKYKSDVFTLALRSKDELFHVALYDWLCNGNMTEKLLEVQSPFLESYLKRKAGYQGEAVQALDMLWKYYEKLRNFPAAAKILSKLAERHGNDVRLQQRIEYLSRAIMCAKSSTTHISSAADGEFLHELEEKMEVARLQLQVQKALSKLSSSRMECQEALNRLDSDLLDLTILYEDFADKFDLSECKLAIVHCAGLYDVVLVESLWKDIIDKEILSTGTMDGNARVKNLDLKLTAVGKLYIKTERYFPSAFLIKYLEQRSCEMGLNTEWVFELMLETGLAPSRVFEIYDRLFKSRDPFWLSVQKPLRLLEVLCKLLCHLVANPALIPMYDRRTFTTVCLDSVASYLVELQAMRSTESHIRLISQFKRLQSELERL
ncbi:NUP155 [Mytilus edulis]|uniref:NUP155 n=1 Tax=Mytilus edulis TaxID=6550 RepID=A0A8S3TZ94_MYTED|nr:NUP155 [Mytilus edulis]